MKLSHDILAYSNNIIKIVIKVIIVIITIIKTTIIITTITSCDKNESNPRFVTVSLLSKNLVKHCASYQRKLLKSLRLI